MSFFLSLNTTNVQESLKGTIIEEAFKIQKDVILHNILKTNFVAFSAISLISIVFSMPIGLTYTFGLFSIVTLALSLNMSSVIKAKFSIIDTIFNEYPKYD